MEMSSTVVLAGLQTVTAVVVIRKESTVYEMLQEHLGQCSTSGGLDLRDRWSG